MSEAFWKGHLERVIEAIPSGVVVMDREGRLVYANAAAERILGEARDRIVGRAHNDPSWNLTTVDGAPLPDQDLPFARVLATGKPLHDIELAIARPEGMRVALSINAEPVLDGSGAILGLVTSFTDITERKRSEALRVESEERYRRLVELSPDPVVVHSEGKIVYIIPPVSDSSTPRARRMLSASRCSISSTPIISMWYGNALRRCSVAHR